MAKITITFQEEGQQPSTIEIPAAITQVLENHVQYLNSEGANLTGKTDLFIRMTWQNWLKPVLERQGYDMVALAGSVGQQYQQLMQQAHQKRMQVEQEAIKNVIRMIESEAQE